MLLKRVCTVSFCFAAAVLVSACYRQLVSTAYLPPEPEWHSEAVGQHVRIYGPDVKIIVAASNETARRWISRPSEFAISLWFDPKHRRIFQFDPDRIRLVSPKWGSVVPRHVSTVAHSSPAVGAHTWECWSNRRQPIESKTNHALQIGDCFELYFNVMPPSPDETFSMHIEGLTLDGQPLKVPVIYFREGSFWVSDFLGR